MADRRRHRIEPPPPVAYRVADPHQHQALPGAYADPSRTDSAQVQPDPVVAPLPSPHLDDQQDQRTVTTGMVHFGSLDDVTGTDGGRPGATHHAAAQAGRWFRLATSVSSQLNRVGC